MSKYLQHIQHAINKYGKSLIARLQHEGIHLSLEQAMEAILAADPTDKKILADWIVKIYVQNGFLWEDIDAGTQSKVADTLRLYREYYKKLTVDQRDLYSYQQLADVYAAIKPWIPQPTFSGKQARKNEREAALSASIVVHRSEKLIIAVPLTEKAAVWWGKGTRWCTSATKSKNYFDQYNQKSPLIVITLLAEKPAVKLQLWLRTGNGYGLLQFMDENDAEIKQDTIEKYWDTLEPIVKFIVAKRGEFLLNIPDKLKTKEICKLAVEQNPLTLGYVPLEIITKELCEFAIKNNGFVLKYVPEKMKSKKLCKLSVASNCESLAFVPSKLIDMQLCLLAIKSRYGLQHGVQHVPIKYRTDELYREAVSIDGKALYSIPQNRITSELCRLAVSNNYKSLSFIPHKLRTQELCLIAIKQDGLGIRYFDKSIISDEIARIAVQNNWHAIEWLHYKRLTLEIYRLAVDQDISALCLVPETLLIHFESEVNRAKNNDKKEPGIEELSSIEWDQSFLSLLKQELVNHENNNTSANGLNEISILSSLK